MPNRPRRTPSYRHYKPKNLGVVRINGHDEYLGPYNSDESWEKYHRLIAEWLGNPQKEPVPAENTDQSNSPITVKELILSYWQFAKKYYSKGGEPTKELTGMQEAIRPLRQLYGNTEAGEFGPKSLKTVRQHMIQAGLSRGVINHRVNRIKRVFKWAVAEELISPSILHGLQALAGLRYGQTTARETDPVRPIPDLYVAMILPFVTPHVAAMIKLQRLTGMRAGEIVVM